MLGNISLEDKELHYTFNLFMLIQSNWLLQFVVGFIIFKIEMEDITIMDGL